MHRFALGCAALFLAASALAQPDGAAPDSFASYAAMRARVVELYQAERFAEAAAILEGAIARYPERLRANAYNLALVCARLSELVRGLSALEQAVGRGLWFGAHDFDNALWDPYRGEERFAIVLARSEAMLRKAREAARPERLVVLPEGYDPARAYPLFIALHGGGENIAVFKEPWTSPRLRADFIVAYLQSSLLIGMDAYNWTEDIAVSEREIADAYAALRAEYRLDVERTLIGGFSSGGVAALEVALAGEIPVAGFVVLCPDKPEGFTAEALKAAAARGLRGTLLTTEMDGRIDRQREMAAMMAEAGLPHAFEITPDIGHWYPDDLPARIDQAIAQILEGGGGSR